MSQKIYSRIIGTGGYLPEKVMTNADLEKMVDTSDEWIRERTGIEERRIAAEGQTTCDLAEQASLQALEMAGVTPQELDLILVATTTPDKIFPSTATLLQARLGNHGAPAFDLQAVCTGFVYALSVADQYIKTGMVKRALVVGAETLSRITNWEDRNTCVLFGDGAGAVVLEASEETGILSTHIHADGQYEELLHVPSGPSKVPQTDEIAERTMSMKGNEVFKIAVNTLSQIASETLNANQMEKTDLDWLVPHQANSRIIKATARKLRLGDDQTVMTVSKHANTSSASIPLALNEAVRDGRIQKNQVVLLEAFGGGFTWGSALLRF
ncbi:MULTISPECIES: beta-ketoacyl-ACP synthase III [Piscirickettsiaceae]|jgi:3-oxoacyl-[acyl-carrier-protein] synthase-3|uniref:Beta-ketoacyl-[acyl-carrier-protein] synthase III n=1 Tax=Hydrogenovibrio thermophilus TaxID=265883 RepID=A0A410H1X4_9GAMM|nr:MULTISPECIES: beta-ketoacyl-ACP synthase III [Piscirickettsiaceae]AZR82544.1 3-oxoacyl-ACP synthase [Thiomicrospira sp. S5]QAB14894.1 ketoacyl-ACP synthase III [Hydrogenovibrio thermophilus]